VSLLLEQFPTDPLSKSSPDPVGASSAPPITASTSSVTATFLPLTFGPGWDYSLPTLVPVKCNGCGTVFAKNRSTLWRVKPGTPLYCSKPCQYGSAKRTLTCEHCGTTYQLLQADLNKAKGQGLTRTFCGRACFQALQTGEAQARIAREVASLPLLTAEALITSETIRGESGRRRYYDEATKALSDGVNRMRPCVSCGKVRKSKAVMCWDCLAKAKAATYLTLPCSYCAGEFVLMRAEHEKRQRKGQANFYCGHECAKRALKSPGHPCLHCETPTGSTDRRRRYCSRTCRLAVSRAGKDRPCPQCGRVFFPHSSRTQYCDRICADAAHSARMIGAGNSHYKDGTSYAEHFRRMRPLIIERDQHQCRACGAPDKMIPTGRKTGSLFKSHWVIHHLNEVPWDNTPENLILLCRSCHMKHHKSATTPFPWFATYTESATRSMTSKWTATVTSLQTKFSSTTA
jgi:hypothetical protein